MAFIQDPRLRQRWNQLSHDAEAATENAAAGIWTFSHRYITPCLAGVADSVDGCVAVCVGDRDERARRARERDRGARRARAESVFDFYDDWDEDYYGGGVADVYDARGDVYDDDGGGGGGGGGGGLLGRWGGAEDWDRLLAGTGSGRGRQSGDVVGDQPRRKRGMSYGTRGPRRKASGEEDPTIIPSTTPLGFLGRLPFKIGGPLRYKPSAANLRDHPGAPLQRRPEEADPLLGPSDDEEEGRHQKVKGSPQPRARSNTAGSGGTSDSYRSRNDLFPSDGEGDEDAVPLDDEFDVALDRVDDRGSNKTRSSKGKRRADGPMSRTVSRTTVSSVQTRNSLRGRDSSTSIRAGEDPIPHTSLEDLRREEEEAQREEDEELRRRRRAASQLALKRGLSKDNLAVELVPEPKAEMVMVDDIPEPSIAETGVVDDEGIDLGDADEVKPLAVDQIAPSVAVRSEGAFVPARLPHFR